MSLNSGAQEEDFESLGIEEAGRIGTKPRFLIHSKSVINTESEFEEKQLCGGPTFTAGHACVFSCKFCYVHSILSRNKRLITIMKQKGLGFQDIVVEIADAPLVGRKSLLSRGKPKYNDPSDQRVIFGSPLVDVAGTMDQADVTVEICLEILKLTHWHIRLLSKSHLLLRVAKGIPHEFRSRMIFGLSTGTLDSSLAKAYEVGTSHVSNRLETLHKLQDDGYRTFGMVCPILPQENYDQFAQEVAKELRVGNCEHVWAEVINQRGNSLRATSQALREANRTKEADLVDKVVEDATAWEEYAQNTFLALQKVIPPEKFRFLQYVSKDALSWWQSKTKEGAILLGKEKPPTTTKPPTKNNLGVSERLSHIERDDLKRYEKDILNDMHAFIRVGKALTAIKNGKLYRETHDTFEAYCIEKFDMGRAHAYRLIAEARVVEDLSPIGDILLPANEAQVRELTKAPQEKRGEIMKLVATKLGNAQLTAKAIQETVEQVNGTTHNPTPARTTPENKRVTIELPVFVKWLEVLKNLAEQNQTSDLVRLLSKAQEDQKIALEVPL